MSSIGAEIIEAEEVEAFEDKFREQWRQDTLKMNRLDKEWKEIYSQIDGVVCRPDYDNEFIEREMNKGGRHEWK